MKEAAARFLSEMRRRKVTRVAAAYLIVAWVTIEVADTVFPHLGLQPWTVTLVIALLILGFPIAMVLAWAYDLTPAGVRRTEALPQQTAEWPRVQQIVGSALELPAERRAAYVRDACAGNAALRDEVESLLAAHEQTGMLDRPAALPFRAPRATADSAPSLSRSAPHYEVQDRIGGGGMGVVYRARDRRLERVVALKFLPPHMSADDQANERFLVEAQAAAALDHPNICTIYEAGETDDGRLFLAMPYYDGETLKRRLEHGPLGMEDALRIGVQVASGLAKAHERGIIHRDIKPANLMLTADGVVKIVDFGVAKLVNVDVTRPGMALGTVAYMSPEQAEGDEVDGRTDVWSLGVVLYEMLTGERPFRGAQDQVLLNAISTAEPAPLTALRPELPAAVEDVVLRALAKRRSDRYASAREMAAALNALRGTGERDNLELPAGDSVSAAGDTAEPAHAAALHGPHSGETTSGGVLADGERRQATVVVSMLSGYDALVERLVPDELNRLLDRLRADADAAATLHGGILNQFAGDQLVLLFGVPTTQEDDAVRAARAALELHARFATLRDELPTDPPYPPGLHTGVDTGAVIAHPIDNGDRVFRVTGAAPQVATRLAQHAGGGEVWLSTESRNRVAPYFETEPREPLTLRDRRQPLVPYRVLAESGLQTRIEASARVGLTTFTGRDAELATLRRCLQSVIDGEGQLVTITGEAGMGKSRLLHEFRHGTDVPVLMGRCQSYGGGVAYLPFIDVLRTGLGLGEDVDSMVARVRAISPTLEEFIPLYLHLLSIRSTAWPVPRHLQGDAFRLAMQEALAAILTLNAQRDPSIVILEDWHWADDASQTVLRQIAEVLTGYRLLVLVTSRPGYGVDWGAPGQITNVTVRPMEPDSTRAMLRGVLAVEQLPESLVTLVHERTGGNPFFIEEICHALLEEGAVRIEAGSAELVGPVQLLELPDSIQGVIRARLDRLDRNVRDVLRLAAVIGREFARSVLERALTEHAQLPQALETLKSTGLIQQTRVVPDAGYRFKHVLTQEVAYASLLEHQRRELHGRVGSIIEELHGDRTDDELDRLAHHFSRAESWDKAVQYGLRSADRANRLAQYGEALQILERTQRWLARMEAGAGRDSALIDVLLQQERLCETLGHRQRQQQLIDQLISLLGSSADGSRLAEVYLRQGDLFTLLGRFTDAEDALQRSLELRRQLGDRVGERNTLRSLGLLRWHEGRNAEALEAAEETLRIDRERGDQAAIVGDLTNCGAILRALGEHDRALTVLEEALEVSERPLDAETGDPAGDELAMKRVYALQHLANIYRERGQRARALECLHRAGEIAEQKRLPIPLAYHYTSVAHVYLQEGRVEESLQHYRASIELTRKARYAIGLAQSLRIYGEVLIGLGRHEEALPYLQEAATTFAELRDTDGEVRMWRAIAESEEKLQRHAAALAAWSRAGQLLRQLNDPAGELVAVEGIARTTRAHVGEPTLALAHYQRGVQLAGTVGDRAAEGRMRNVMGILEWNRGDHLQALAHYERALELFRELGDDAHTGLMLNSVGATLKALGRSGDADRMLTEALELNRRNDEKQLEAHTLALLGDLCADRDDTSQAAAYYAQSLELRRAIGDRRGEGWMLHGLARSELAAGAPYRVREHVASAARIADETGDAELASACEQLRRVADQT